MSDPTRDEMRTFLLGSHWECDIFDIEAAIYWFANDWHSGQWSNLYSALSMSEFRPGSTHNSIKDEGEIAEMLYNELETKYSL